MCGRYANFLAHQELVDAFTIATIADDVRLLPPSWNVAPTQSAAIVLPDRAAAASPSQRTLAVARWGLVPSWAKDPSVGSRLLNARSETVAEKPSFRSAFASRRCLVPANGYYEWQVSKDGKTPHFIRPADDAPLAFAGLFEWWRDRDTPDAPGLSTFTILTTAARDEMQELHDRQPVMLTPDNYDGWLDTDTEQGELFAIIAAPAPALAWHRVGAAVGNVRNNSAELVEPAAP